MKRKSKRHLGKQLLSICLCLNMALGTTGYSTVSAAEEAQEEVPALGETITTSDGEQDNTWKLVWQDEFNGTNLDETKWGYQVGDGSAYGISGWGNNELQYYTEDGNNVSFEDGKLVITAKKNTDPSKYQGAAYTSGRLWTKGSLNVSEQGEQPLFSKKYGRFEAKISMPAGTGYWPAFWMMPTYDKYGGWALSGEIDIMEARGREVNKVDGTLHYGGAWPNNKSIGGHYDNPDFNITDEHIYALEWLPGVMRWYVDGVLFYETSDWYTKPDGSAVNFTYPAPFDQEFYLMLNLAVGGNYDQGQLDTTLDGGQMKVDYVRVYDLEGISYDENVQPPEVLVGQLPEGIDIGSDLITGSFDSITTVTSDYANNSTNGWDLVYLPEFGGSATASKQEDGSAKVNISAPGNQTYSVQLMHKIPLTTGYRYKVSFDAKADAPRTIEAKVSNPVNYSLYSDVVSASLSTNYTTQEFTFDMSRTSETARLELNLGLNNIPVSIKNVKFEVIGLASDLDENAPKVPLANGEHVYNGTFDQGNSSRMQFWKVVGSTASVSPIERALKVTGAGSVLSDAYVEQVGINLLKNDTYQVKFSAKTIGAGNVKLELLGEDGVTVYGSQEYLITDSLTPNELTFTMGENTDEIAKLRIYVGGNAEITLDDVSMKRLTNHNVSYDGIKIYPVGNGDFAAGTSGWSVSQTDYEVISEDGSNVCFAVGGPSINNYDKMLMYLGVDIVKGQSYTMKFKAKTSSNQSQPAVIRIQREGGDWASVLDENFTVTNEWNEFTYTFTAGISGNLGLKYLLGSFSEISRFYLKDVELYVTAKPLLQGAFFASTQAAPKAGEDIVVRYYDNSGWEDASNMEFSINAQTANSNLIGIDKESNTVTFDKSLFPLAGTYTIQAGADGYDTTNVLVQSVMESSGNLVVNGTFDSSINGWSSYFTNGCGNLSAAEGKGLVHFIWHEGQTWDLQVYQDNIPLEAGKAYVLEFDASATIRRPITVELGTKSGATPLATAVLETSVSHYKFRYDAAASNSVKLNFLLGNVSKGDLITSNDNNAHDMYLDNIVIREMTPEELAAVTPEMKVNQTIKVGENSILSHSVEAAWNAAQKTVYLNQMPVAADKITFEANQVILDQSLFAVPGTYAIVIKAEGMDDTTEVTQSVVDAEGEFIKNGTFTDFSGWGSWFMNGEGTGNLAVTDGELLVHSAGQSSEIWAIQVFQDAVPISQGIEYTLSFDAKSSVAQTIVAQCGGQPDKNFDLTTDTQKFTWTFTSGINSSKLNFLLATKSSENNVYTIEFDNISMKRSSDVIIPPVDPEDPPVNPEEPPVNPEDPPVNPEEPPVNPDPTPVNPDPTPVNPDPTPVNPDPTPVNPNPSPVVIPQPTIMPEVKPEISVKGGLGSVVITDEKLSSSQLSEALMETINHKEVKRVALEVVALKDQVPEVTLSQNLLKAAATSEKDLSYVVKNQSGNVLYEFKIASKDMKKSLNKGELSLGLKMAEVSKNEEVQQVLGKMENKKGIYLDFSQDGLLPTQSEVKILVKEQDGIDAKQKLYLYAVNTETGKLEPVPYGTTYRADKDGYVNLKLVKGDEYVLLTKKPSSNVVTPFKDLVEIPKEISINKGKKLEFKTDIPETLEQVYSLDEKASLDAKGRVVMTYQTSDSSIAGISAYGFITPRKSGTVTFTTTVKFYYGATFTYQTKVTIN